MSESFVYKGRVIFSQVIFKNFSIFISAGIFGYFLIHVELLNEELAKKFHIEEAEGVMVTEVDRGSIAYTEGLREGDVIREVNRVEVKTMQQYFHEMELIRQGETVLLRVLREARAFYVVLKLQG